MWLFVDEVGESHIHALIRYGFRDPCILRGLNLWELTVLIGATETVLADLRVGQLCTPNLPTNIIPTKIAWLKLSGKSPMGLRIPAL